MQRYATPMLSLAEAAKQVGRDKSTILRAIQKGKISASKDAQEEWQIDPAELFRVYEPAPSAAVQQDPDATAHTADATGATASEINRLRRELEARDERLALFEQERERERRQLEETVADLRSERDRLLKVVDEQAGTVKLLTDQRQQGQEGARQGEVEALRRELEALRQQQELASRTNKRSGLLARLFGG